MAQKELVFKLKYLSEGGEIVEKQATTFNEIKKSVADLQKELENTDLGSEQFQNLQQELKKSEGALASAKDSTTSLMDSFTSLPGPIGGVINGAKALNASLMKLVLNPIGAVITAIVLAVTALYKAFASTKAGAEQLDQLFAGISAAMDVLRDRVLKVGSAIVKFFTGDFSGALDDAKGAVSGIGEEVAGEFQEAMAIKKELQSVADATRELSMERAKQNKLIAAAKLVINDETKSYQERLVALEQVRKEEIALAKQEEVLAERRYEAIKAQNALSDSSKEALEEEAQAYIALQTAQQASLQKQKELFDQEKALRDRQRAEAKAAAEERKRQEKEVYDFVTALNQELIRDEKEKEISIIREQEKAQISQLKQLKVSAQQGQEILAKIVETTQRKINDVEQKYGVERVVRARQEELTKLDIYLAANAQRINGLSSNLQYQEELLQISYQAEIDQLNNFGTVINKEQREQLQQRIKQQEIAIVNTITKLNYAFEAELALRKQRADLLKQSQLQELQQTQDFYREELDAILSSESYSLEQKKAAQLAYDENMESVNTQRLAVEAEYNLALDGIEQARINRTRQNDLQDIRNQQKTTKQKAQLLQAWLDLSVGAANALSQIAGENTKAGKAFAAAGALVQTYQAAQAAYLSQFLPLPTKSSPLRGAIAAATAVLTGLANVRNILAQEEPEPSQQRGFQLGRYVGFAQGGLVTGQGSSTMDNIPAMLSNGESVINANSTAMFGGLLSVLNQLGGGVAFDSSSVTQSQVRTNGSELASIMNKDTPPIKAYVVSTEISSQQELDRKVVSRSTL
jgi:hypothetical protein